MRARPRRKNACAPAASTTILTMSAIPRAITPSSKCWAISPSETISRKARSSSPGTSSPANSGSTSIGCSSRSITTTTRPMICGKRSPASTTAASSASPAPTISGAWATPAPAAPARRSSTIRARRSKAARPAARTRTATDSWSSGTSSSCNMSRWRRDNARRCRAPRSTPAWGLERIAALMQGVTSNYDIDLFRALTGAVADFTGAPVDGPQGASHRVIADHLRASSFLVADGVRRRTKAAAMCCAGSCAAPCAMRSFSARRSR